MTERHVEFDYKTVMDKFNDHFTSRSKSQEKQLRLSSGAGMNSLSSVNLGILKMTKSETDHSDSDHPDHSG